jgi:hypothetical protein
MRCTDFLDRRDHHSRVPHPFGHPRAGWRRHAWPGRGEQLCPSPIAHGAVAFEAQRVITVRSHDPAKPAEQNTCFIGSRTTQTCPTHAYIHIKPNVLSREIGQMGRRASRR